MPTKEKDIIKDNLRRSLLSALGLLAVNEVLMRVAATFFQQPSGRITGFIQDHNRTVANIAVWVFYFIIAGVWVFAKSGVNWTPIPI